MSLAGLTTPDLIGTLVGLVLTLAIFTYILGDNALFRLGIHIFIGAAAGYAAVTAIMSVIWPHLLLPLISGSNLERLYTLVPLILSLALLLKVSPGLARLGNPAVAYLVGVGVAAALGGAVMGTIFPQVTASTNLLDLGAFPAGERIWALIKGIIVLFGTVATLAYFHYGARPRLNQPPSKTSLDRVDGLGGAIVHCCYTRRDLCWGLWRSA